MSFRCRVGIVIILLSALQLELINSFSIWGGVRQRVPVRLFPDGSPQLHYSSHYKGSNGFFNIRECRLRCTAVALTVSADSVCNEHNTQGGISSAPYSSAGSGEGTVVGEIVLSGWLDELPMPSLSLPHLQELDGKEDQLIVGGGPRSRRSEYKGGEADYNSCAPVRFQHLVQGIWATLNQDDQLSYLGGQGQGRVKAALTVLAAYCALREHPLQAGVNSPQQAFSEMDFNSDGEVSFDEFVRWYSMSTAHIKEAGAAAEDSSQATMAPQEMVNGVTPSTETVFPTGAAMSSAPLAPPPAGDGASRLIVDLEKRLTLDNRGRRPVSSTLSDRSGVRLATNVEKRPEVTEAEREVARERWLASGRHEGDLGLVPGSSGVSNHEASPAEDLDKALELLRVLVRANADADTLIAALASCIIRNPMGRYNLEVIEEQFGPIIRGIVEERLLLERLPEPTSAQSYVAIRQVTCSSDGTLERELIGLMSSVQNLCRTSRGVKPVLDLDDHHAKLMREYLVRLSKDCRAVVVHMADLTCRLRGRSDIPTHARHSLALEALQLYVPVSNALGLGASFRELEELAYKSLFPVTYSETARWHHDVKGRSHDIVVDVKRRMLEALRKREDLASRVRGYRVEGRTKGLVSTFRKVFRQNKRATDVHDIIGFRIIVCPASNAAGAHPALTAGDEVRHDRSADENASAVETGEYDSHDIGSRKQDWAIHVNNKDGLERGVRDKGHRGSSGLRWNHMRSVFTVKTFPPPYRDADSRLLHDVYEVLVGLFEEVPGRFKNYVDFPKANGYRSVHTTVKHPSGLMMEFQVRTSEMHAEAEGGAAAHSLYKGSLENPVDASLFRSKMALDTSKPAQNQLPSIASRHRKACTESGAAVALSSKEIRVPDPEGNRAVNGGVEGESGSTKTLSSESK